MAHPLCSKYCIFTGNPMKTNQEICSECGCCGEWPQLERDKKEVFLLLMIALQENIIHQQDKYRQDKNETKYQCLYPRVLRLLKTVGIYDGTREKLEACLRALVEFPMLHAIPLLEYMVDKHREFEGEWCAPHKKYDKCHGCQGRPYSRLYCEECIREENHDI